MKDVKVQTSPLLDSTAIDTGIADGRHRRSRPLQATPIDEEKSQQNVCTTNVTRSHKRGLKSLEPIRATGKEVKDNRYVHHLAHTLQLAITLLSFKIRA